MVRILIDGFYLDAPSGYGRTTRELCRALAASRTAFEIVVAVRSRESARMVRDMAPLVPVRMPPIPFPSWEQIAVPLCALARGCRLIHFPYNTRAAWTAGRRSVTTVHDLTFLLAGAPRDVKSRLIHTYMNFAFEVGTRRSDRIIAVSETTRQTLGARGLASQRIYNTVDSFLTESRPAAAASTPRPYLLHRGSYQPGHRNTDRVIRAFLATPELARRCDLVLLGVPDGAALWNVRDTDPIRFLPRVSDDALAGLYRDSAGVVAPSLLEGFCLPIVEAFGFGTPVVTSAIDPMREIAGDAALLVSPHDEAALGAAMLRLMTDTRLRAHLVARGRDRLRRFASEETARQVLDVYEQALGERTTAAASELEARPAIRRVP